MDKLILNINTEALEICVCLCLKVDQYLINIKEFIEKIMQNISYFEGGVYCKYLFDSVHAH